MPIILNLNSMELWYWTFHSNEGVVGRTRILVKETERPSARWDWDGIGTLGLAHFKGGMVIRSQA
jgi:hypothetical protein